MTRSAAGRTTAPVAPKRAMAEDIPNSITPAGLPGIPIPTLADRLATALRGLDLDAVSPREALQWLWEQQERLAKGGGVIGSRES
jgi:hypothetical protein